MIASVLRFNDLLDRDNRVLALHDERQQGHESRALDRVRELALVPRADAGALARNDLSKGGKISLQHVRILVVNRANVCLAERTRAFGIFDWHRVFLGEGVPSRGSIQPE